MCRIVKPEQLAVTSEGGVLAALALGSSLCICMYDEQKRIGGMVHALLPYQSSEREKSGRCSVDTAVLRLYQAMLEAGAEKENLSGKMAGGARLFSYQDRSQREDVGRQNVEQAHRIMQKLQIPVIAEDTGENYGRTAYFYTEDGRLEIETAGRQRYKL